MRAYKVLKVMYVSWARLCTRSLLPPGRMRHLVCRVEAGRGSSTREILSPRGS